MITFIIALIALILGYVFYGRYIGRLFDMDPKRPTPAMTKADGMDYVPMPTWKVFMIQFLNIAGLGPIFGAIMGAQFGTASYLWIVFGTIFAGAVHDFSSGMMSMRRGGESLPQLIGRYLGKRVKSFTLILTLFFLILAGTVFVSQPAQIIVGTFDGQTAYEKIANDTAVDESTRIYQMTNYDVKIADDQNSENEQVAIESAVPDHIPFYKNIYFWIILIFAYYLAATLFPINTIIGRIYPIFAIALLFMAISLMFVLLARWPDLPEMWNGFGTKFDPAPIFPMMFVSIACGAISGFHATQSPMMARCLKNEKHARPVFYGAMVAEGIVALIWAAAATSFFQDHGPTYTTVVNGVPQEVGYGAGAIVNFICHSWLGRLGGVLAVLGVVFAPISSGDTALRAARLIVADALHVEQKNFKNRMLISVIIFAVCSGFLMFMMNDPANFGVIWRYFAWSNQVMAAITLWAITVYLTTKRKNYFVTLIPAMFMSVVATTFILEAPTGTYIAGKGIAPGLALTIAILVTIGFTAAFYLWKNGKIDIGPEIDEIPKLKTPKFKD
ncbi:MAG: carbon starvation protein A [Bacteroidales bacterium]|nr:carbon starvation protein A [Bacteroidales bacterium]